MAITTGSFPKALTGGKPKRLRAKKGEQMAGKKPSPTKLNPGKKGGGKCDGR